MRNDIATERRSPPARPTISLIYIDLRHYYCAFKWTLLAHYGY